MEVWKLYQTSKTFNSRPSTMMGIAEPYAAYCLDAAVGEFGRALENELNKIDEKTQKKANMAANRIMQKWLDVPVQYRSPKGPTKAIRK